MFLVISYILDSATKSGFHHQNPTANSKSYWALGATTICTSGEDPQSAWAELKKLLDKTAFLNFSNPLYFLTKFWIYQNYTMFWAKMCRVFQEFVRHLGSQDHTSSHVCISIIIIYDMSKACQLEHRRAHQLYTGGKPNQTLLPAISC